MLETVTTGLTFALSDIWTEMDAHTRMYVDYRLMCVQTVQNHHHLSYKEAFNAFRITANCCRVYSIMAANFLRQLIHDTARSCKYLSNLSYVHTFEYIRQSETQDKFTLSVCMNLLHTYIHTYIHTYSMHTLMLNTHS